MNPLLVLPKECALFVLSIDRLLMNVNCNPISALCLWQWSPFTNFAHIYIYDKRSINTMSIYLPILLFSVVSFAAGRRLFKTFLPPESQPYVKHFNLKLTMNINFQWYSYIFCWYLDSFWAIFLHLIFCMLWIMTSNLRSLFGPISAT